MNIQITPSNQFIAGWLACYLGLERTLPHEASLKQEDIEAFYDGWEMCKETIERDEMPILMEAFHDERRAGNIAISWK